MTDIDEQLRGTIGRPPVDPAARERALIRLRAEIAQTHTDSPVPTRRRFREARILIASACVVLALLTSIAVLNVRQPAVAGELERLKAANITWAETWDSQRVRMEELYMESGGGVDGSGDLDAAPSYTVIVHSVVTRTRDGDAVIQAEQVLSSTFASAEDKAAWKDLGSPPIKEVGMQPPRRYQDIDHDFAAISTDPSELREALEDGSVLGYLPDRGQVFEAIGSLLMEPELSSEQRATLYEVVGSQEGVELLGDVADPRDRVGVGFACMVGSHRQVLIFDRDTGQPLAFEEYSAVDPEQLDMWVAFAPPPISQP